MSRCLIEVGLRGWTWHPTRVARALRARETCVLAAETPFANAPDRLAGFAIAEFGDTKMHLSLFAVKPAYQRSGIGLAMIEWLIESALTAGITAMCSKTARCRHGSVGATTAWRLNSSPKTLNQLKLPAL